MAENLLGRPSDDVAIIFRSEDGEAAQLTRSELHDMTGRVQQLLIDAGVGSGDRVAAWMPNRPETYAVMLAAAGLGAVFSSTSPDFGTAGVLDRFRQISPTVLFACADYPYGGRRHDCTERLLDISANLPSLNRTVLVEPGWLDGYGAGFGAGPTPAVFRALPFDHPWYVLYSSGTTGPPKCIVHRAGGLLIKHLSEHRLHCDVQPGDRVFYYTTTGWMMWNWLASTLSCGAAAVLYDGSPAHPGAGRLFDLIDEAQITLFGHFREVHRRLRQRRHPPRGHPRPVVAAHHHIHRLDAGGRGIRLGVRQREGRRAPGVHLGRHRPVRLPGGRRPDRTGTPGRDTTARAGPRHRCRGRRGRASAHRHRERAGVPQPVPVDAAAVLGRPRRRPLSGPPTSSASPASGTTATSRRGPRREGS